MHTRHPASASYFDPVLGRKDEKGGERCRMTSDSIRRRGFFLNPLQRYKIILEYANFEIEKVKFFAIFDPEYNFWKRTKVGNHAEILGFFQENRVRACVCQIFVVTLHAFLCKLQFLIRNF